MKVVVCQWELTFSDWDANERRRVGVLQVWLLHQVRSGNPEGPLKSPEGPIKRPEGHIKSSLHCFLHLVCTTWSLQIRNIVSSKTEEKVLYIWKPLLLILPLIWGLHKVCTVLSYTLESIILYFIKYYLLKDGHHQTQIYNPQYFDTPTLARPFTMIFIPSLKPNMLCQHICVLPKKICWCRCCYKVDEARNPKKKTKPKPSTMLGWSLSKNVRMPARIVEK